MSAIENIANISAITDLIAEKPAAEDVVEARDAILSDIKELMIAANQSRTLGKNAHTADIAQMYYTEAVHTEARIANLIRLLGLL